MPGFDLPYFDQILAHVERAPDSALAKAFRRHVHWGCFTEPETADDSLAAYVAAAEEMTSRVCRAGQVAAGRRILDVGCGFGGTLEYVRDAHPDCRLTGVNIDGRQLRRARRSVAAFVQSDACVLPFTNASFDTILAVECIFHFSSRKAFFREVARVLKPGGTLALTDFVIRDGAQPEFAQWLAARSLPSSPFYGPGNGAPPSFAVYERLARVNQLECVTHADITRETLPTYAAMRRLYQEAGMPDGVTATDYLEAVARLGFIQYRIAAFRAPPA